MRLLRALAIAAVLAACSNEPPRVVRDSTAYTATFRVAGGGERTARVTLREGGTAAVQVTSPGPSVDFFGEGNWQQADNTLIIELPGASPSRQVFRAAGELLIGREWDRAVWGEAEPVLYRVR